MAEFGDNKKFDVEKPSRYTGNEWNSVVKTEKVKCRLLLAFPDTYEIGMSHLGQRIIYDIVNKDAGLAAAFITGDFSPCERVRPDGFFPSE